METHLEELEVVVSLTLPQQQGKLAWLTQVQGLVVLIHMEEQEAQELSLSATQSNTHT